MESPAHNGTVPERALWLAVLMQSIRDNEPGYFATDGFRHVCELAGLDPDYARDALARADRTEVARRGRGWSRA